MDAASEAILMNWYNTAQDRIFGEHGRRRQKVNIDISDDEDERPNFSWAQKPVSLNDTTTKIAVSWLRDARSKLQRKRGWESGSRKYSFNRDDILRN